MTKENITLLNPDFDRGGMFIFQSQKYEKKWLRRNGFLHQKRHISPRDLLGEIRRKFRRIYDGTCWLVVAFGDEGL